MFCSPSNVNQTVVLSKTTCLHCKLAWSPQQKPRFPKMEVHLRMLVVRVSCSFERDYFEVRQVSNSVGFLSKVCQAGNGPEWSLTRFRFVPQAWVNSCCYFDWLWGSKSKPIRCSCNLPLGEGILTVKSWGQVKQPPLKKQKGRKEGRKEGSKEGRKETTKERKNERK